MSKNPDVQTAEDIAERKLEGEDIKKEISKLKKMLKTGFHNKTDGMEKVSKTLASNDPKKISKFYIEVANIIKALAITDNLEKFNEFLAGYSVSVTSGKELTYLKKGKKKEKFQTLYSEYFYEDPPQSGTAAGEKILQAMETNYKTLRQQDEALKEEAENLSYSCSKRTFNTLTSALLSAKKKDVSLEEVIVDIESKLSDQQQAVDLLEKNSAEE